MTKLSCGHAVAPITHYVLIIDYPDTLENRGKVEAIRAAWKQQTGQLSVLRVTQAADVSF